LRERVKGFARSIFELLLVRTWGVKGHTTCFRWLKENRTPVDREDASRVRGNGPARERNLKRKNRRRAVGAYRRLRKVWDARGPS